MSTAPVVTLEMTHHVRDHCLCLHTQRAARALARRFDDALRPIGLTSGQFSLLMALNRPNPPPIGPVASMLAMDRTTLTANLKPLVRRCLIKTTVDPADRRSRLLNLTDEGRALLHTAVPVWEETHAEIDGLLADTDPVALRVALRTLG